MGIKPLQMHPLFVINVSHGSDDFRIDFQDGHMQKSLFKKVKKQFTLVGIDSKLGCVKHSALPKIELHHQFRDDYLKLLAFPDAFKPDLPQPVKPVILCLELPL